MDVINRRNVFNSNSTHNNTKLLSSITGILSLTKGAQHFLLDSEEEYKRLYQSKNLHKNLSWGINNRSTLIRISSSSGENFRIKFRFLLANSDLMKGFLFVIYSALYGRKYNLTAPKPMYGNANDHQYQITKLSYSKKSARALSDLNSIFSIYL